MNKGIFMKLKRIRDLREDNDLTQADIAKYLNVTQRTYSRYENDDRAIPLEQLVKLVLISPGSGAAGCAGLALGRKISVPCAQLPEL